MVAQCIVNLAEKKNMSYLKQFGIGNFKVFNEITRFDLAPVTILTGKNNSGKSSLIKSLVVIKNCLSEQIIEGEKDFKDNLRIIDKYLHELKFDTSDTKLGYSNEFLNCHSNRNSIIVEFSLDNSLFPQGTLSLKYVRSPEDKFYLVSFSISNMQEVIVKYQVQIANWGEENMSEFVMVDVKYFLGRIEKVIPNFVGINIGEWEKNHDCFASHLRILSKKDPTNFKIWKEIYDSKIDQSFQYDVDISDGQRLKIINQIFNQLKKGRKLSDLNSCPLDENILKSGWYGCLSFFSQSFHQAISEIVQEIGPELIESEFLDRIKNLILLQFNEIHNDFKKVSFLPSIRAKNERLYLVSNEGYAIQSITQKVFENINFKNKVISSFYSDFLNDFELGEKIVITTYQNTATEIAVYRDGRKFLLSDLGFGYAQLIPILFTILRVASESIVWQAKYIEVIKRCLSFEESRNERPKIFIEEPESNLHPDFQAKLADLFVKASKLFGIQFIIETHSEYLIRQLQCLTARKDINPEDISIYYFNNPIKIPEGEKQVNKIEIRQDGILKQDFGSGFYDQAANSTYDLFRLIGDN